MISLNEAFQIVINQKVFPEIEEVDFLDAIDRVLAENIYTDIDFPSFDRSAMDGYACKWSDIHKILEVIEIIPAGKVPEKEVFEGQCAQIMTGAMIPKGADCVLMVEYIEKMDNTHIRYLKDRSKTNIRYKAEDLKSGDLVLEKGTLLYAAHLAVLASVGAVKVKVYRQPQIGIISTGDEIVEPNLKPELSQIRNSNAYQLMAQVIKTGAKASYIGKASDNKESTFEFINKGLENSDMIILTGGVSMGEFDHVPAILKKSGVDILFQKIAVQPGKPTTFGLKGSKFIFGLPGNPVSSFIQFELLVKHLILKMMGNHYQPPVIRIPMENEYRRRKTERMSWFPVSINDSGNAVPAEYHGSAHLFALTNAQGLSYIDAGKEVIEKGELVNVRLI